MIDTKPQKRHRATRQEWEAIRAHFKDERCWCCDGKWTELHHILNRSHSGDDVSVNLAPLCGECHRRIEARYPVARSLLRQALMPSNYAYLRWKLGDNVEDWLERNYPIALSNTRVEDQDLDLGLDLGVDLPSFTTVREQNVALRDSQ